MPISSHAGRRAAAAAAGPRISAARARGRLPAATRRGARRAPVAAATGAFNGSRRQQGERRQARPPGRAPARAAAPEHRPHTPLPSHLQRPPLARQQDGPQRGDVHGDGEEGAEKRDDPVHEHRRRRHGGTGGVEGRGWGWGEGGGASTVCRRQRFRARRHSRCGRRCLAAPRRPPGPCPRGLASRLKPPSRPRPRRRACTRSRSPSPATSARG